MKKWSSKNEKGVWEEQEVVIVLRAFGDALCQLNLAEKKNKHYEEQFDVFRNDADLHAKERDKLNVRILELNKKLAAQKTENERMREQKQRAEKKAAECALGEAKMRAALLSKEKAFDRQMKRENKLRQDCEAKLRTVTQGKAVRSETSSTKKKQEFASACQSQTETMLERSRKENVALRARLAAIVEEISRKSGTSNAGIQSNVPIDMLDCGVMPHILQMLAQLQNGRAEEKAEKPSSLKGKENNEELNQIAKLMVCLIFFNCFLCFSDTGFYFRERTQSLKPRFGI